MKLKIELIAIVMLSMFMAALLVKPSNATETTTTTVFIDCPDSVDIGIFQAKVNISNVIGLYGWEFKLYFDSTLLQFVNFTTDNHFLESSGYPTFNIDKSDNNFNATHGLVWLADTLMGAPAGVNGSGTLVTLTFNATDVGYAELIFEDLLPSEGKNVKLGDKSANQIPNIAEDKIFDIIPEFPLPTLVFVLLTATSATLILAKKYKALK